MANIAKQNIRELETEIMKVRMEMDLLDPVRNDADERAWKLLKDRYNELWDRKINLEKSKSENKKILIGAATPFAAAGLGWFCREVMQTAFWKDFVRDITSPFKRFS